MGNQHELGLLEMEREMEMMVEVELLTGTRSGDGKGVGEEGRRAYQCFDMLISCVA